MLTLPSSHWTNSLFSGSSSTTHPLTKAAWGSLSQTYFLPEKSSPSIPLTMSACFRMSSVLMKDGANVVEPGKELFCPGRIGIG